MKTHLKLSILVMLSVTITCCTNNNNNKPSSNTAFKEEVIIDIDTSSYSTTPYHFNNDTTFIAWSFKFVNNESINDYIYQTTPFLLFSLDSTFIFINSGCNYYLGECSINNNHVKFEKIKIKEEICPIDALEREIVYMLESSNHYILNNNNLILFKNNNPIGLLSLDTINFNYIYP